MTAQATETLIYETKELSLCTLPLSQYFSLSKIEPKFRVESSALWRGYIATWEITNNRLYLIAINAHYESGEKVTLDSLFPGFPNRVYAHWFSGKLRAPSGELIDYVHGGFASKYERDLIFVVKKGEIINFEIKENEVDPDEDVF